MARTTTPPVTTDGQQASVAAIEVAAAAKAPEFDWDKLPEPVAMPNKTVPTTITANVLETVPEPIRKRAEASLAINTKRVAAKAASTAKRARVDYHWDLQPVTDAKMAEAFDKLITKYAKYRPADKPVPHAADDAPKGQVTARTGDPGHFRKDSDGNWAACAAGDDGATYGLRYSVRPFEQRQDATRLPGSA